MELLTRQNTIKKKQRLLWLLLAGTMSLFVLDSFWGFIYVHTIYAKPIYEYASVMLFFFLYIYIASQSKWGAWSSLSKVWAPYIVLTFLCYLFMPSIRAPYWLICLIILLVSNKDTFYKTLPCKILFISSIVAIIGIAIQMYLPDFYFSNISVLFLDEDKLENWSEGYGFNGFTYQLGLTASILIYGEVALLYMKEKVLYKRLQNPVLYYVLLLLIIVSVFLTGKRLLAALALILPFLVYYLTTKTGGEKLLMLVSAIIVSYLAFDFFISNARFYADSVILRRFVNSYYEAQAGNDITSERTYLYGLAWEAFNSSPVIGIGVGQFRAVTGATTAVHNTYLQVLCEQGVIGFSIFIFPIIYSFIYTVRLISKVKDDTLLNYLKVSMAFQLIYIIYSFTGNENTGSGYIMYFIGIAIVISVDKKIRNFNLLKNKMV